MLSLSIGFKSAVTQLRTSKVLPPPSKDVCNLQTAGKSFMLFASRIAITGSLIMYWISGNEI